MSSKQSRPEVQSLRRAVRRAIKAFRASGKMGDAALAYADCGVPIFPVSPAKKTPIPPKINGVPGTGGHYRATTDLYQIYKWWRARPYALIGMPTGSASGVWCIDADTTLEHAHDGVTAWQAVVGKRVIRTREHRTASGGLHIIFRWHAKTPVKRSKGDLPSGIEVKGEGGYIVTPPSVRRGQEYTVARDVDPIDAPAWLLDRIFKGREPSVYVPPGYTNPFIEYAASLEQPVDLDQLADAMRFVSNDDVDWNEWVEIGLALFAATGGSDFGFQLCDQFSQQSVKYDEHRTRRRWREIRAARQRTPEPTSISPSPATTVGADRRSNSSSSLSMKNDQRLGIEEARAALWDIISDFS